MAVERRHGVDSGDGDAFRIMAEGWNEEVRWRVEWLEGFGEEHAPGMHGGSSPASKPDFRLGGA